MSKYRSLELVLKSIESDKISYKFGNTFRDNLVLDEMVKCINDGQYKNHESFKILTEIILEDIKNDEVNLQNAIMKARIKYNRKEDKKEK